MPIPIKDNNRNPLFNWRLNPSCNWQIDPVRNWQINSAIFIRNNTLHEGNAPTLSFEDLVRYQKEFVKFADNVERYLLKTQVQYYDKSVYMV